MIRFQWHGDVDPEFPWSCYIKMPGMIYSADGRTKRQALWRAFAWSLLGL